MKKIKQKRKKKFFYIGATTIVSAWFYHVLAPRFGYGSVCVHVEPWFDHGTSTMVKPDSMVDFIAVFAVKM